MFRINTSTADPDGEGPGRPGFRASDPELGVAATAVSPAYMNALQAEICRAIELAGFALDEEDSEQLAAVFATKAGLTSDNTWLGTQSFVNDVTFSDGVYINSNLTVNGAFALNAESVITGDSVFMGPVSITGAFALTSNSVSFTGDNPVNFYTSVTVHSGNSLVSPAVQATDTLTFGTGTGSSLTLTDAFFGPGVNMNSNVTVFTNRVRLSEGIRLGAPNLTVGTTHLGGGHMLGNHHASVSFPASSTSTIQANWLQLAAGSRALIIIDWVANTGSAIHAGTYRCLAYADGSSNVTISGESTTDHTGGGYRITCAQNGIAEVSLLAGAPFPLSGITASVAYTARVIIAT